MKAPAPVRSVGNLARRVLARRGRVIVRPTQLARPRLIDVVGTKAPVDYVRYGALELCAFEISGRGMDGAVAELGVYRGEFAKRINEAFPERSLYLFDTFAGFDEDQERRERTERGLTHVRDFGDTTVQHVLSRMPHPERCVVRKGVFPETATGIDAQFVFVSIDADLFEPIYDGLSFFYPRMQRGGYIFVHDYNNAHFPGARQAVAKFAEEYGVSIVPLPDPQGSAIIAK